MKLKPENDLTNKYMKNHPLHLNLKNNILSSNLDVQNHLLSGGNVHMSSPVFDIKLPVDNVRTVSCHGDSGTLTARAAGEGSSDPVRDLKKTLNVQCDEWAQNAHFLELDGLDDLRADMNVINQSPPTSTGSKVLSSVEVQDDDQRSCKLELIQFVVSSLTDGTLFKKSCNTHHWNLILICAGKDPEFILKAALYCRLELGIRTTANFLLAVAGFLPECRQFLDKYFSKVVNLPSDWLEVAEHYHTLCLSSNEKKGFSCALKRNFISKFMEFSAYQLAKYNRVKKVNRPRRFRKQKIGKGAYRIHIAPKESEKPAQKCVWTLKKLIRELHISRPTEYVMCLLGKRYPTSALEHVRLGLSGDWDPKLAGERMKLPIPITWETELSKKGNTTSTWTNLIVSGNLPYMALLRNLRNIMSARLSVNTHEIAQKKLKSPKAIIAARQMPFQYYNAYRVITQLTELQRCKKKAPFKNVSKWHTHTKRRLISKNVLVNYEAVVREALAISIAKNVPPIQGSTLIICSLPSALCSNSLRKQGLLLTFMCCVMCESPTTVVLSEDAKVVRPMKECFPRSVSLTCYTVPMYVQLTDLQKGTTSIPTADFFESLYASRHQFDTLFVIGSMFSEVITYVENYRMHIGHLNAIWSNIKSLKDLEPHWNNCRGWVIINGTTDQVLRYASEASVFGIVDHVDKIDRIHGLDKWDNVRTIRNRVPIEFKVERPLSVWRSCRVFISSTFRDMHAERDLICGLIVPTLRQYAAHHLRVHLSEVDLRWGVPEPATRSPQALKTCLEQAASADLFVLLVGDRYGWVPKSALVNTLPKAIKSKLEKFYTPGMSMTEMEYHIAKQAIMDSVPLRENRTDPISMCNSIGTHMFAFFRDPKALEAVLPEYKADFSDENPQKRSRMKVFRKMIQQDGVLVQPNYPAWFNGVLSKRPVMGNLSQLGTEILNTLKNAMDRLYQPIRLGKTGLMMDCGSFLQSYIEPVACAISPRQLAALERAFISVTGRGRQCRVVRLMAAEKFAIGDRKRAVQQLTHTGSIQKRNEVGDGGVLLVTGTPGSGKTTHIAGMAMVLQQPGWCPSSEDLLKRADPEPGQLDTTCSKLPSHIVCSHMTDGLVLTGLPPKYRLLSMLNDWMHCLLKHAEDIALANEVSRKEFNEIKVAVADDTAPAESADGAGSDGLLRSKMMHFKRLLRFLELFSAARYAFLLDDADHLRPSVLDWLPDVLPENVRFVISCDNKSSVARQLSARPDCLAHSISGLTVAERTALVRTLLGRYGQTLKESGIGNQLSMLVNKREADLPLYLTLACEQLHLYGRYEELDSQLRTLPSTMSKMVEYVVARVERECGSALTMTTLAILVHAQQPLSFTELHGLLDLWLRNKRQSTEQIVDDRHDLWRVMATEIPIFETPEDYKRAETDVQAALSGLDHMNTSKAAHLPPLAFQLLLAGLKPLLAGSSVEDELSDIQPTKVRKIATSGTQSSGLIRLRSQEVITLVQQLCAYKTSRLPSYSTLGYHRPTVGGVISRASTERRFNAFSSAEYTSQKSASLKYIHWLLAVGLGNVDHKIHHFFHAGEMNIVHRLLTSMVFLEARFRSGSGVSLMEDYRNYGRTLEASSRKSLFSSSEQSEEQCLSALISKLRSMRRFIGSNSSILIKYPSLLSELAINSESDAWIRSLGIVHYSLVDNGGDRLPLFIHIRSTQSLDSSVTPFPTAIQKSMLSAGGQVDSPTAVALSFDGTLLAYGTQAGAVHLVDPTTMQTLRSYYGHSSQILSLCFISSDGYRTRAPVMSSGSYLWLVSTAQDNMIHLWNASGAKVSGGNYSGVRLATLVGRHRRAATSCAWHPDRRLLVTGGLDGLVVVWSLPNSEDEMKHKESIHSSILMESSSPVTALAFRLPWTVDSSADIQEDSAADLLAVGSWDGRITLFALHSMQCIRCFAVSTAAISSLAFSCDGGTRLASKDVNGCVQLWNARNFTSLGAIKHRDFRFSSRSRLLPQVQRSYSGQLCFSRPDGHYLIESNSVGQLNIWNGHLGLILGTYSFPDSRKFGQSTAFASDPFGEVLFVGTNEGVLFYLCARTGILLSKPDGLRSQDNSRLQSLCCYPLPSTENDVQYEVMCLAGYASGWVRVFSVRIIPTAKNKPVDLPSVQVLDARELWSRPDHSTGSGGYEGGTLCVSAGDMLIATGGGNAECVLTFYSHSHSMVTFSKPVRLREQSSAITAVAVNGTRLATGSKNRCVCLYGIDPQNRTDRGVRLIHVLHRAADDWISALCWIPITRESVYCSKLRKRVEPRSFVLAIGSLDQRLRSVEVGEDFELIRDSVDEVEGTGCAITSFTNKDVYLAAGLADGHAVVWKVNRIGNFDRMTTLTFPKSSEELSMGKLLNVQFLTDLHQPVKSLPVTSPACDRDANSNDGENWRISSFEADEKSDTEIDTQLFSNDIDESDGCETYSNYIRQVVQVHRPIKKCHKNDELRLMIGSCVNIRNKTKSQVTSSALQYFLVAPFLPQLHSTFQGHPGCVVNGISCGGSSLGDCDVTLATVAGAKTAIEANGVACDIRLWEVPRVDQLTFAESVTHESSITCLSVPFRSDRSIYFLSGGADSSFILWRVFSYQNDCVTVGSQHQCSSVLKLKLQTAVKTDFSPIVAIEYLAGSDEPSLFQHTVCVASGFHIFVIEFSDKMLSVLKDQSVYTIAEIESASHLAGMLKIHKMDFPTAVVGMAAVPASADVSSFKFDLVVSYANASALLLSLGGDREKPVCDTSVVKFCNHSTWPVSLCRDGSTCIGVQAGVAFQIEPANEGLKKKPLFQDNPFLRNEKIYLFEPLEIKLKNKTRRIYVVVSELGGTSVVKIILPEGRVLVEFQAVLAPQVVTAACCLLTTQDDSVALQVLVASLDGMLRLWRCSVDQLFDTQQFTQFGICPTGERITSMRLYGSEPLFALLGCHNGRIMPFSIYG